MALNLIKHIPQSSIYDFDNFPYSEGQKFFTSDTKIFYEDIGKTTTGNGYRCAVANIKYFEEGSEQTWNPATKRANLKNTFMVVYSKVENEWVHSIYYYDSDGSPKLISGGSGGSLPAGNKYDLLEHNSSSWVATKTLHKIDEINFAEYGNDDPETGTFLGTHQLRFTTEDKTLSLQINGVNLQIGQEMYMYMHNPSSNEYTIKDGRVIKSIGAVGGDSPHMNCAYALSTEESKYIVGVATEDIAPDSWGFITVFGVVRNFNSDENFLISDILYLKENDNGNFQNTLPSAGHSKTSIAMVLWKSGTSAPYMYSIFVRPTHTFKLESIDDMDITDRSEGDSVFWNAANSYYEHKKTVDMLFNGNWKVNFDDSGNFSIQENVSNEWYNKIKIYKTPFGSSPERKIEIGENENDVTLIHHLDFGGW